MLAALAAAAAAILVSVTIVWLVSLKLKDAGIVDAFWGPGFVIAIIAATLTDPGNAARASLVIALASIWALRLASHILFRSRGQPEDARYAKWRRDNGESWWWKSYLKVFLLQGSLMWLIAMPLTVAVTSSKPLGILDAAGAAIWAIGLGIEATADWQLLKFKANPDNKGKVLDAGWWHYSRHPNYFGEAVLWFGFGLIGAAVAPWTLYAPILMLFLLLKVSGVAMLDKLLTQTKPQYRDYIQHTNAFIPGPKH